MIAKALATILFVLLNFSPSTVFAQSTWNNTESLNMDSLNNYIIKEINILRKKKKVDPLVNEKLLLPAANDHAEYMNSKSKLTHIQRFDKKKKTPKNRVNFYGQQFELVGENVQQWDLNIPIKLKGDRNEEKTETYERLAKALVLKWKNSKGHYANMMDPDYTSTFTSVKIDEDGRVYACQLLGNNPYTNDEATEIPEYKPERPSKCWRCGFTSGWVSVTKDSLIVLELGKKNVATTASNVQTICRWLCRRHSIKGSVCL